MIDEEIVLISSLLYLYEVFMRFVSMKIIPAPIILGVLTIGNMSIGVSAEYSVAADGGKPKGVVCEEYNDDLDYLSDKHLKKLNIEPSSVYKVRNELKDTPIKYAPIDEPSIIGTIKPNETCYFGVKDQINISVGDNVNEITSESADFNLYATPDSVGQMVNVINGDTSSISYPPMDASKIDLNKEFISRVFSLMPYETGVMVNYTQRLYTGDKENFVFGQIFGKNDLINK